MKRILFSAAAILLGAVWTASSAFAHGGSFRGPSGGVPPGLREPSDPQPPPPPPSDPGSGGGPTTPGDPNPSGPTTPGDSGGPQTPNAPPPAPMPQPTGGQRSRPTTKTLTYESWRFWWAYNNDDILNLKGHIYSASASSSSPLTFTSKQDEENRRNAQRPTEAAIETRIIPALLDRINRVDENDDVRGGAVAALGKVGSGKYIQMFNDILHNDYKNPKGQRPKYQYQTTESAVLALGLLPDLDALGKQGVRDICLKAISDTKLRWRERTWAAVCIGFQRDKDGLGPLWHKLQEVLKDHSAKEDLPAGILAGIGLIGQSSFTEDGKTVNVAADLAKGFKSGRLFGMDVGESVQAFIGYALLKIGDPSPSNADNTKNLALNNVLEVLRSRRMSRVAKRTAAIAAGVLGGNADEDGKKAAVKTLISYLRHGSHGDASGENFALIALSQIGTRSAIDMLLDSAEHGKYNQRPYAALGLGTYVFYHDRAQNKKGEPVDPDLLKRIKTLLRTCSDKFKDSDTRSAFYLARGLVKDETAVPELVSIAASHNGDPLLRGFACESLGLIGVASQDVKDALKLALEDYKSEELREGAAVGLSLLRDAEVVDLLLKQLAKARSFAVQSQLIRAIGTIGDHRAITPLVKMAGDNNEPIQTRAMAVVGLGMIGDLKEIPTLSRLSKDYNWRASTPDLDELLSIL